MPQQQPDDTKRNCRGVQPRQASAPFTLRAIGQFADNRVRKGIKNQRGHDDSANDASVDAKHLIIENQQEDRKSVVLDAIGNGAKAVHDF